MLVAGPPRAGRPPAASHAALVASPLPQVELEWVGHAVAARYPPPLLAAKFMAKVRDLLEMRRQLARR
jgi:hypothetical protein